jgi:hypothetical protein
LTDDDDLMNFAKETGCTHWHRDLRLIFIFVFHTSFLRSRHRRHVITFFRRIAYKHYMKVERLSFTCATKSVVSPSKFGRTTDENCNNL